MSSTSRRALACRPLSRSPPSPRQRPRPPTPGPLVRTAGSAVGPPARRRRPLRRGEGGRADRGLGQTARTPSCGCAAIEGADGADLRGPPARRPVRRRQRGRGPRATTTPTCSPASRRPRSARTPRCGSTSPSTTAPAPRRHPCRSSRCPGRARSSSTRSPPTTTRGSPGPGSHASRSSGDAAVVRRGPPRPPGLRRRLRGRLVWGIVARVFMRLLTTSPEFTWAGTLGIVGTASVVGGLVALVRRARLSGRSRWWRLLGLPFVLLFFAGRGSLLAPGRGRRRHAARRRRWLRVLGAAARRRHPRGRSSSSELGGSLDRAPVGRSGAHGAVVPGRSGLGRRARSCAGGGPAAGAGSRDGRGPRPGHRPRVTSPGSAVSRDGEGGRAGWPGP